MVIMYMVEPDLTKIAIMACVPLCVLIFVLLWSNRTINKLEKELDQRKKTQHELSKSLHEAKEDRDYYKRFMASESSNSIGRYPLRSEYSLEDLLKNTNKRHVPMRWNNNTYADLNKALRRSALMMKYWEECNGDNSCPLWFTYIYSGSWTDEWERPLWR